MSIPLKIVVTGANGQLGRCLHQIHSLYPDFAFHFLGREHLPIDNHELTRQVLDALKPDILINTAAYTTVDKAEDETAIANNANGYAVGNLAKHCRHLGARFVHISTDYVFNGLASSPYLETDQTDPVNAYGASKLLGETLAMEENPASLIIRTSWVYSKYGKNFLKTMQKLMAERDQISVVNDQFGSPTSAVDLANCLMQMIRSENDTGGVCHFSNEGVISWFQFAQAIRELGLYSCNIEPIPTSKYPTKAKRPQYSVLDCKKIQRLYGIELKPWRQSLEEVMNSF